jgi:hypothetical protein
MLETTECIPINNRGRKYTDCMEFSLLRFLHLLFFDEKEIKANKHGTWYYNNINIHNDILEFINCYPFIYKMGNYYDRTEEGKKEREEWSKLVSDRDFFEYYRNDSAELFTNVKNILLMFKNFFKLDLKIKESEYKNDLNKIAETFSRKDKIIKLEIKSQDYNVIDTTMDIISKYLSKTDKEYTSRINSDEIYKMIIKKTIIDISINNNKYEWHLMEYVLDSIHEEINNKFITGHSVIYKIK